MLLTYCFRGTSIRVRAPERKSCVCAWFACFARDSDVGLARREAPGHLDRVMGSLRHLRLPASGVAVVNTDLHGNGGDFRQLEAVFRARVAEHGRGAHWVILGDVVHGPSLGARKREPQLYDYEDESAAIVARIVALRREFPEQVHFVLGNHDYAHVGGVRTSKFFPDEAAQLESTMTRGEIDRMHTLFSEALLAVSSECGVLMTHGSPDATLRSLADLNEIDIPRTQDSAYHDAILRGLLFAYGQRGETTARLLGQLNRVGSGKSIRPLRVVVHGHDRAENGLFCEGGNQVCPVLFGAVEHEKRYVELDLSAHYASADALRDGIEVRRLHRSAPRS